MKTTTTSILLALAGLFRLGLGIAEASDHTYGEVKLQLSLTAQQQVLDTNYHASFRTVRIGTKQILQMLGAALTNDLTGYSLKLRSDNSVQNQFVVVPAQDGPEFDVTRFFTVSWGEEIWQGTVDPFYGPMGTGFCMLSLGFDDGQGHSFTVMGPATERAATSSRSTSMITNAIVESNSWQMKAAGEGMVNGSFALFQGYVSAQGRWTTSRPGWLF